MTALLHQFGLSSLIFSSKRISTATGRAQLLVPGLSSLSGCWGHGKVIQVDISIVSTSNIENQPVVAAYGICVLLSALGSEYGNLAWTGYEGWYMGAVSQLLFVGKLTLS